MAIGDPAAHGLPRERDRHTTRELDRGANYRRYYASYFSEGLRIYALLTVPFGEPPAGGWPAIVFNHGYIPPDEVPHDRTLRRLRQ